MTANGDIPAEGAITIHHVDHEALDREEYLDIRHPVDDGDRDIDRETFEQAYFPAETILGTTDLDEAYHHAQGEIVNREQAARHMVASAQVGDVFEVLRPDGIREYYVVEPIGFEHLFTEGSA